MSQRQLVRSLGRTQQENIKSLHMSEQKKLLIVTRESYPTLQIQKTPWTTRR